jgi:hypothetical protein
MVFEWGWYIYIYTCVLVYYRMSVVTLLYIMMFKQYIHYDTLYKTSHTYVYIYVYIHSLDEL